MSVTKFLTTAIGAALELGVGTADDVMRFVTPDVLGQHLPRPLWARLITACLGASKLDAQLVVDTIGVPNLCEHMPGPIMWNVLADIAQKSLGRASGVVASKSTTASGVITQPASTSGSQPVAAASAESRTETPRSRSSSRQPFRTVATSGGGTTGAGTGSGAGASSRGGSGLSSRRPQAAAAATPIPAPAAGTTPAQQPASALVGSRVTPPSARRGTTSTDFDIDTDVRAEQWKKGGEVEVEVVDDDQLIDWSSAEETVTGSDYDQRGNPRKP